MNSYEETSCTCFNPAGGLASPALAQENISVTSKNGFDSGILTTATTGNRTVTGTIPIGNYGAMKMKLDNARRDTMSTRIGRIGIGAMMATTALVALGIPTAQAYTFTFNDMGLATNSTQWNTLFSPYTGPPGFSSSGTYNVVATISGNPWTQGSAPNAASYVARPISLLEFIQNDPNFTGMPGSQFSTRADTLNMPTAWTTVGGAGTVANGIRNTNGTPGPIFFQGQTGAQTGFTFNQIVLSGTGTFDLQVRDTSNNVILPPMLITLSSTAQTIPVELLNANNIDFLNLSAGASIVVNSVEINDAVPAVPEPSTWAMMLLGFVGLAFAFSKSRRMVSVA